MATIDDFINPQYLKIYERNRKMIEQIMRPSLVMQHAISIPEGFQHLLNYQQKITSAFVPSIEISNAIRDAWSNNIAYRNAMAQLNIQLHSSSIIDCMDFSDIEFNDSKSDEFANVDIKNLSENETEIIDSLSKDDKFIEWCRKVFPSFMEEPATAIAKFFFYAILAPLIVEYLRIALHLNP